MLYNKCNQKENNLEKEVKSMKKYIKFKDIIDKLLAIVLLILVFPICIIISILIKIDSKGPVIYKHKRVGKNEKTVYVYKFRTMVENAEELKEKFSEEQKREFEQKFKLNNDPRITKLGKKLRKLSLDEIPQLINVLKGELSIVGPRPITLEEVEKFGEQKQLLLSIKPGIVGAWTANGRSNVEYEERIRLELDYIKNLSLKTDIIIIFKTIIAVIKREGAV